MAPHIRTRVPMPGNSPRRIRTGPSRAASGTTFLKKLQKRSPTRSSRSTPPNEGALMPQATTDDAPLTVVLVHGAFADASSWNGVIERLQAAGIQVTAPANLPPEQTAVMAATQRPVAESAFSEPSGPPAWKSSPAWAVVATGDKAAGTDVIRSMAERAGATITEADGSHVIMVSQAGAVADVIMTAAAAVDRPAAAAGG